MQKVAFDVESTGLSRWRGHRPFCISFYFENEESLYFSWHVDPFTRAVTIDRKTKRKIEEILLDPNLHKGGWGVKFDYGMLQHLGIPFKERLNKFWDAMLAFKCLKSNEPAQLKQCAAKYAGISQADEEILRKVVLLARKTAAKKGWAIATTETHPEGSKPYASDFWLCPEECERYNVIDSKRALMMMLLQEPLLKEERALGTYKRELGYAPIVYQKEERGLAVRRKYIVDEIAQLKLKYRKAEKEVLGHAWKGFNVNSHKQVAKLLFDNLGLEPLAYTETGQPATGFKNIQHLKHPCIEALIRHNSYEKSVMAFESYLRNAVWDKEAKCWIVHPNFKQIGADTGRESCNNPNLQNVRNERSVRSSVPINVRAAFKPRPGYVNLHFDYSQVEIWLYAADAEETYMLEALKRGDDIHTATANKIWPAELKAAKDDKSILYQIRTRSKMVNFGISFGAGGQGIKNIHGCTIEEAGKFIQDYFTAFPKLERYMTRTTNEATKRGYIRTMWSRKLIVPEGLAYRGINYRVQGSAAEVLKQAMAKLTWFIQGWGRVKKELREKYSKLIYILRGKDARVILAVHDEIVLEVKKEQCTSKFVAACKTLMEDAEGKVPNIDNKLPVKVEIVRENWGSKEKYAFTGA